MVENAGTGGQEYEADDQATAPYKCVGDDNSVGRRRGPLRIIIAIAASRAAARRLDTPSTMGCSDVGLITDPVSVDPCWLRTNTVSRNVPSPFGARETHRAVRSGAAIAAEPRTAVRCTLRPG